MRRPGRLALATTAALLVIALPTLRTHWTGVDASVLPTSKSARVVSDTLARDFSARDLNTITIAATAPPSAGAQLSAYTAHLRALPAVAEAQPPAYLGRGVWKLPPGASGHPNPAAAQPA